MARVSFGSAALSLALFAGIAQAKPPAVLDRLPSDAAVVVALRSVDSVHTQIMSLADTFGGGPLDLGPIDDLITAGALDMSGSAGLALSFPEGEEAVGQPVPVALVPVGDYELFLETIEGETDGGIAHAMLEGEDAYFKQVEGGYVAVAQSPDVLAGFSGEGGNAAAHGKRLGSTGRRIADESDLLVVVNVEPLAPMIREGASQMSNQMAMAGAMMGQADQMTAQAAMFKSLGEALADQGQAIVFGGTGGESGLQFDAGVQFKEGTTWAGYLDGGGRASSLLARVPDQPFLYAFAADFSTPGLKAMVREFVPEEGNPMGNLGAGFLSSLMDKVDGEAMIVGSSPAGMMGGGLFLNAVTYYSGPDPEALAEQLGETIKGLDGEEFPGMKLTTSYTPESGQKIGETVLQEWSMASRMDPQVAGQMNTMMMMMFGPTGGPNGYMASSESGVVMTMSRNRDLAAKAIEAANSGDGFGSDAGVKGVARSLPGDRFVEGYLGMKEIGRMVTAFLPMVTGQPVDVQVPEDLPPLGMGGVASEGGVRFTMFAPAQLVEFAAELAGALEGIGQLAPGPQDDAADRPRF